MLKTKVSTGFAANPKKTKGGVGGNSVVGNVVGGNKAIKPTKEKFQ